MIFINNALSLLPTNHFTMKLFLFLLSLFAEFPLMKTDTVLWNSNGTRLVQIGNSTLVNDNRTNAQNKPRATHKASTNFTIIWNEADGGTNLWGSSYNDVGK